VRNVTGTHFIEMATNACADSLYDLKQVEMAIRDRADSMANTFARVFKEPNGPARIEAMKDACGEASVFASVCVRWAQRLAEDVKKAGGGA